MTHKQLNQIIVGIIVVVLAVLAIGFMVRGRGGASSKTPANSKTKASSQNGYHQPASESFYEQNTK